MKRLLCAVLSVLVFAGAAFAQKAADFETDGQGKITGYLGSAKNVVIPSVIGGIPVTSIDNYVFASRKLTAVTIPDSVTHIGNGAFAGNPLKKVTIGGNVTVWEDSFNNSFAQFYIRNKWQAGTYVLKKNLWVKQ